MVFYLNLVTKTIVSVRFPMREFNNKPNYFYVKFRPIWWQVFNFSPTSNSNDDVFTSCFRFLSVAVDYFSTASRAYFDAQKSLVWKVSGQTDITIEFNDFLNIY